MSATLRLPAAEQPVLELRDISVEFGPAERPLRAVAGVDYVLGRGETLGVVGESGSGKSVTALAVLGLLPTGRVRGGSILFEGRDLLRLPPAEMRGIRGNRISMIFQVQMTSLNPVLTVGWQIAEVIRLHRRVTRREALDQAEHMLERVRIPDPRRRLEEYPHQLSGGMRQRVMIAIALACRPAVLLADEPTTALDVTIQAQIVDLMAELQQELGTGIVLISHDMGLVAETCRRVAVMYAGRIVEEGPVEAVFADPRHPYTRGLLFSIPRLRTSRAELRQRRLHTISGVVPSLSRMPAGCAFRPRCTEALPRCAESAPPATIPAPDRSVRCWLTQSERRLTA